MNGLEKSQGQQVADKFNGSPSNRTFQDVALHMGIKNVQLFMNVCEQKSQLGLTPMQAIAHYCSRCDRTDVHDPAGLTFESIRKYADLKCEFEVAEFEYFGVVLEPIPQPVVNKVQQAFDDLVTIELRQQVEVLQAENLRLLCENRRLRGAK